MDTLTATSPKIGWHPGKLAASELDRLEREIAATGAEIDNLVCDLYGITDGESRIVKGL